LQKSEHFFFPKNNNSNNNNDERSYTTVSQGSSAGSMDGEAMMVFGLQAEESKRGKYMRLRHELLHSNYK
jgi:hypothetical protein